MDDLIKTRELSTNDIKTVLNEAASLGCMSVIYTGGEPLFRVDLEELYIHARKLGISVTIRTNATLITPHLANIFIRIPPKMPIMITVYGMNKNTYEAVTRIPGSFEAFRKGVDLLIENKIPFKLTSTVTKLNFKDLDDYKNWLLKIPCEDKTASYTLFIDANIRRGRNKNNVVKRIRLSPEEILDILKQDDKNYFTNLKNFCMKFMGPQGDKLFFCTSCTESCSMDAYGNLMPCIQLGHPDTIYDLRNGSINDAMTNFFPKVREIIAKNPDYLTRCARCFLHGLCEQCPAKSWMEHGTLDTPVDYLCDIAHLQARDLGLLKEGEKGWEVTDWQERINSINDK
jgi:radical SAM protein with 4Fe4S-binding SPASM domain